MWTLEANGQTKSLAAWGLVCHGLREQSFGASEISFETADDYDAEPRFAFRSAGILRLGDTIVFQGRWTAPARSTRGNIERHRYTLRDVFWHLENLSYAEPAETLAAQNRMRRMRGGRSVFGTGNLGAEITTVITHAAAKGAAVQIGSVAGLGIQPQPQSRGDATCATMLQTLHRWCPDAATQIDPTTTPPTLHFIRRADATAHTLPVPQVRENLDIEELPELAVPAVIIRYVLTGSNNGEPSINVVVDKWPLNATGDEEGAIVATVNLRGPQTVTQKQALDVVNIAPNAQWFWEKHGGYSWLKNVSWVNNNNTIANGNAVSDDGFPALLPNMILSGAVPHWKAANSGTVVVTAEAKNFVRDGQTYESFPLRCSVQATSLMGGVYESPPETTPGDTVPLGVAQAYYESLIGPHFRGSLRYTAAEIALPRPRVGDVLNLTGGEAEARGWHAMRAPIQAVEVDIDNATTVLHFGPAQHLSLADLQERLTPQGRAEFVPENVSTPAIMGSARSPGANAAPEPTQPSTTASHPYYLAASGLFTVGTINGGIPLSGGQPIGAAGEAINLSNLTGYVYLNYKWTVTESFGTVTTWEPLEGYVPTIAFSASPLTDQRVGAEFTSRKLIAELVDGVVQHQQPTKNNLTVTLCSIGGTLVSSWGAAA